MYEFFGPSKADLRTINEYNRLFLECLPEKYDAIELSPITPFGGNSSFTNLSQKNILSSIKSSEVCSDATTSLTLEACKRRKERIKNPDRIMEDVNLATIKKVLRICHIDIIEHFIRNGFVDRKVVNANSFNDFKLFEETGIKIPDKIVDYGEFTDNQKQVYCLRYLKDHIESLSRMIEELKKNIQM